VIQARFPKMRDMTFTDGEKCYAPVTA